MILCDWRDLPVSTVRPLQDAERNRWVTTLAWDLAGPLEIIEDARASGYLPGFVALDDDGAPLGWTYFILHDGMLQIGGLTASRPSVVRALLDAVLASPEAALARRLSCFIYPGCDGVASAFARQRFTVNESLYLQRDITGFDAPTGRREDTHRGRRDSVRPWRDEDLAGLIRLLEATYQGVPGADCFAPDGRRDQWVHYASQLVRTPACGAFDPGLSIVVPEIAGMQLPVAAAVIATRVGPSTVHIAQLAVAPSRQRQGLAETLVSEVMARAAAGGCTRITLMVDARNHAARALYTRLGFVGGVAFLFGQRAARNRIAA